MDRLPLELLSDIADAVHDVTHLAAMRLACRSFCDGVGLSRRWRVAGELNVLLKDIGKRRTLLDDRDACLLLACKRDRDALLRLLRVTRDDTWRLDLLSRCCGVVVPSYLQNCVGLTVNDARTNDNEALQQASRRGHLTVLRYLREGYGLTADDARASGNWALRWASKKGHVDVLKYLREGYGLTADDARAFDNEALRRASQNGHLDVLQYLEGYGLAATSR